MEDHDRGRCKQEYEQAILEDLDWLGLHPDIGTLDSWDSPSAYRQSDSVHHYEQALHSLSKRQRIYACDCSRKDILQRCNTTAYDSHCAHRKLSFSLKDTCIRFGLEKELESFDDVCLGPQEQHPVRECGDFPLRDRDGNWTYHMAVVVDDLTQGINCIIRGEDLLHSTARQIQLARALDPETPFPITLHHPLITDSDGRKLSKRDKDSGIRDLRHAGHSPQDVLGMAAHQCGLVSEKHALTSDDLASLFQ